MKTTLLFLSLFLALTLSAQVGVGTIAPDASSILDVQSNEPAKKGLLLPRLNNTQRDGITTPANGLIIYNTTEKCVEVNIGTKTVPEWACVSAGDTVTPPTPLPTGMTISADKVKYIASILDSDYLPYATPTGPATTGVSGDGGSDTPVDLQGTLTTTGLTVTLPYTATSTGLNYDAYSQTVSVPANLTTSNVAKDVEFSYPAGATTGTSGTITLTIKAVSTPLDAIRLDVNAGIGDGTGGVYGVLLAEATLATDASTGTGTVQLRDIPGIPDRNFGNETKDATGVLVEQHNLLYLPIVGDDDSIWLNHNLGANYADINNAAFNIAQEPISQTDTNAYGSLYQYGRFSDGHEKRTSLTTPNISSTSSVIDADAHKFIINPDDWYSGSDALWQGENGINNPCPEGFRLPTAAEFEVVKDIIRMDTTIEANINSILKLTDTGWRNLDGTIATLAGYGYYRTSSVGVNPGSSTNGAITNYVLNLEDNPRGFGFSIRCKAN